jgi:plasmid stability protein
MLSIVGESAIIGRMRQLITRIDDRLHARLKERALQQGWSLNALVVEVLEQALADERSRIGVRERARRSGRLVCPPSPARVPSRRAVEDATRGAGTVASEALAAERAIR